MQMHASAAAAAGNTAEDNTYREASTAYDTPNP
jgi:hypothetical protein